MTDRRRRKNSNQLIANLFGQRVFTLSEAVDLPEFDNGTSTVGRLSLDDRRKLRHRINAAVVSATPDGKLRREAWALLRLGYAEPAASPQHVVDFLRQRGIRIDYETVYYQIVPRKRSSKGRDYQYGLKVWGIVTHVLRLLKEDPACMFLHRKTKLPEA